MIVKFLVSISILVLGFNCPITNVLLT